MLHFHKFDCRNHKGITYFRKILQKKAISFITGKRLQSLLRSTTFGNFKPETFEGRKLKIVQVSEQAKARIFEI
jgi:hypothetical protein